MFINVLEPKFLARITDYGLRRMPEAPAVGRVATGSSTYIR